MASTKTQIYDALNELESAEFEEFKWRLANDYIPRGKLEKANRHVVVDLMEQRFGTSEAGRIAVLLLRSINQNNCAEELERKLQEVPEDVSAASVSSSGAAAVNPPIPPAVAGGVTVNASSSNGGTINAPVLHGGDFAGPLTFNFN